jgi:acetylornithine deacetylase
MSGVVDLLRDLVSISSVSSESNRGVIGYAQQYLIDIGWNIQTYPYVDSAGIEKVNLIASPGPLKQAENAFHLALVCHTDTVPHATSWIHATNLLEEGGNLKGCGACDVKGFLACILAVAGEIRSESLNKPLAIVLTADEEIGCVGARHLLDLKAITATYAIIGEPTSLQPIHAGKGYCLAEATVHGREAHSAYPDKGVSAIYRAARLIVELEKIAARLKEFSSEDFSPPYTTINIGEIQGGIAKNIVAPSCRFLIEWRPIAGQDADLVLDLVQCAIAELSELEADFECDVKVFRRQPGFATRHSSALLSAVSAASGNAAGSVAFGTEAPWLNKMGAEAIVFGPGSMQSAHSPREFVPREELHRCVTILNRVIHDLCG